MGRWGSCSWLSVCGLALFVCISFSAVTGPCLGADVYPMASASMGGALYRWMAVVSQVLNQEIKDSQFTVRTGSPRENVLAVEEGDVPFAALSPNDFAEVHPDDPQFNKTRIRAIWPMIPLYRYLIVPEKSPYKSYGDLKGKRVAVGIKTGEGGDFVGIVKVLGWKDADMKNFYFIGKDEGIAAYKDKTVDAWTGWTTVPSPHLVELAASKLGARVIPMSSAEIKAVEKAYSFYRETVIPAGSNKVIQTDSPTVFTWYVLVVRDDLPEKVAYEVGKAIEKRLRDIDAGYKGAGQVTPDKVVKYSFFKLHPGIARLMKEKGVLK